MSEPFMFIDQILIILVAGIVAGKLAERIGIPSVLPLFAIGWIVGPEGLNVFAPLGLGLSLSALVTLVIPVILFEEGIRIDVKLLSNFKLTVFTLATVAVAISTIGVGIVAFMVFKMPLLIALLLGAILAATSAEAASTVTELFNINRRVSTVIEAEASLNDATAIVLFTIISGAIIGTSVSFFGAIFSFVTLFFGGLVVGTIFSLVVIFFIRRFKLSKYIFYLSLVSFLGAYALAEIVGASGATAVVASGLIFGEGVKRSNGGIDHEKLRDVWSNFSFISRSIIFLVLGAGFSVSAFSSVWVQATVIVILLFAVIRPISVYSATFFEKRLSNKEKFFVSWIGSRGAVPAALAISAIGLGIEGAQQIFDIVIVVVLASLIIVGFTSGKMAKRMLSATG